MNTLKTLIGYALILVLLGAMGLSGAALLLLVLSFIIHFPFWALAIFIAGCFLNDYIGNMNAKSASTKNAANEKHKNNIE